jgi:hypothetical protein
LFNISDELAKPPAERNMLPLVDVYCPVCVINDCSLPGCPISIAKWDGMIYGEASVIKTEDVSVRQKVATNITLPDEATNQLSLFT